MAGSPGASVASCQLRLTVRELMRALTETQLWETRG